MTDRELLECLKDRPCDACKFHSDKGCSKWDCVFDSKKALEQEPNGDLISRQAVMNCIDGYSQMIIRPNELKEYIDRLPPVNPQEPKAGYISIDDVMSVFDDFMCGEVDEDGTETFLEMLKDKAESEE